MSFNISARQPWQGILAAIVAVALAASARALFLDFLGPRLPFVTFLPAVLAVLLYRGVPAGLLAVLLSISYASLRIGPLDQVLIVKEPADRLVMVTSITSCLIIYAAAKALQRAQTRAANAEAMIELVTQQRMSDAKLRESDARYRALFDNSTSAIFLTMPGGEIIAANRAACSIFGMTEEEICQRGAAALLEQPDARLTAVLGGRVDTSNYRRELTCLRIDGARFHAEITTADLAGNWGTFIILNDITERKQAEEALHKSTAELQAANATLRESREMALNLMKDAVEARKQVELAEKELQQANAHLEMRVAERTRDLEKAIQDLQQETTERIQAVEALREKEQMLIQQSRLAAMGEMIGNIAHQWRQPLNLLGLTIQEVEVVYDLGELDRNFLAEKIAKVMGLIQHMSKTIDDFKDYFKPGKEKTDFNVREVIEKTLSLLKGSFQDPQISVEIIGEDDPLIHGYPNEFGQVLINLVVNAKDILIESGIDDPKVTIGAMSKESGAVVTVADNGGGIPEEIMDKIFDPYFTTKGKQGGTGIGLFMSKAIIEKNMGGRLSVRNVAGGAEFRIEV